MNYDIQKVNDKKREIGALLFEAEKRGEIKLKSLVGNFGEVENDINWNTKEDGFRLMFYRIDFSGWFSPCSVWRSTQDKLKKEIERLKSQSEKQYSIIKDLIDCEL